MWLLDTDTLELKEFVDSHIPLYAIFSHTWGDEEISFHEMQSARELTQVKAGFTKIVGFCGLAKARGYRYAWMDTCCIDKRNSADLSEAINSMYRYYRDAGECLIYLSDVPTVVDDTVSRQQQLNYFRASRWFTRGWTLQELLAPKIRTFVSGDWIPIDDKGDLVDLLAEITNIDARLLRDRDLLSTFCTAKRMSWASTRQTTRSEDIAYSLMGIFNIYMPVIYGEGGQRAFRRLQEEIIRTSFDQSIFVWRGNYESSGLLAKGPSDFADTPRLGLWGPVNLAPFTMTNVGLSIRMNITKIRSPDRTWLRDDLAEDIYLAVVGCDVWDDPLWVLLVLYLQPVPGASFYANGRFCNAYRRVKCNTWMGVPPRLLAGRTGPHRFTDVLVLQDEHFDLVKRAIEEDQSRFPKV
jgi:hypothetical protein